MTRDLGDERGRRVLTPTASAGPAALLSAPDVPGAVTAGTSAELEVLYDSVLGEAGRAIAADVLHLCQTDLETVRRLFGGIKPPNERFKVVLARLPEDQRAYHYGNDGTTLYCDVQTTPWVEPRYSAFLAASLLIDVFGDAQGRGWDASTAAGEALSRVLATSIYPRRLAGFATASVWLDSERSDFVNHNPTTDRQTDATGCAVLFLNYLHAQLGFRWDEIVAAGGVTLADTAARLTGSAEDPFPMFRQLLDNAFVPGVPARLDHDNPFPLPPIAERTGAPARQPEMVSAAGPTLLESPPAPGGSARPSGRSASPALASVLDNRRWMRCTTPFPHLRAVNVFVPEFYDELVAAFRALHDSGRFAFDIPGYDASAMTLTAGDRSALTFFHSRAWHDLLATLLGVDSTGDVDVSLHHHAVGSLSGTPHNDLNPGWFVGSAGPDATNVSDPAVCGYRTGLTTTSLVPVERVRAVALIYYLANPPDCASAGGGTGLYREGSVPVDTPDVTVPPINNSLVAFRCTPFSFHSFITNPHFERNALVMWLHCAKPEVVRRFGEASIVGW